MLAGAVVVCLLGLMAHWTLTHPWGRRDAATVLVLGVDQERAGHIRSDTLLLARLQLRPVRQVKVVSLPRDTRVLIPGHGDHKLNAAFSFGGADLARTTVQAALGIPVDYVVVVNSSGLARLVDALGGVTMTVPKTMDYDDSAQNLHIHLRPGEQRLAGEQAVGFVRFRSDRMGDLGRVERQQAFVKALAQQSLSLGVLGRAGAVRAALRQAVQTDLSSRQALALAYSMRGLSRSDVKTMTLPGRPQYLHGVSYYAGDMPSAARFFAGTQPPTGELSVGSAPQPAIAVLNGCGRNGYARRAARQLRAAGLSVVEVANAPAQSYAATLVLGQETTEVARTACRIIGVLGCGSARRDDHDGTDGVVKVIIGGDYRPAPGY
jgi:LCP family protein required for cell wall assembly